MKNSLIMPANRKFIYGSGKIASMKGVIIALIVVVVGAAFFILTSRNSPPMATSSLSLTSIAFEHNGKIPAKYTCDGNGKLSPPLSIDGIPEGTKSLVLIMDDPDIPTVFKERMGIEAYDHWTLYNIPPETREMSEGEKVGDVGANSSGAAEYTGPCPPPEYEPSEHRYIFKLYALSDMLQFAEIPTKQQVQDALEPFVLGQAELIGRYSRK